MAEQVQDNQAFTGVRLPTNIRPKHYDISLKPDLDKFTFEGKVDISYSCSDKTNKIVLNTADSVINSGSIEPAGIQLVKVTYSEKSETATLEFKDVIPQEGCIRLNYNGNLNNQMKGFYRTVMKIDEHSVNAACTQFEPTDARYCFPCWDEPAIKATFSITLTVPKTVKVGDKDVECLALSNMPEIARKDCGDLVEVKFDKSPIMSTYLLACVVGPYECIETINKGRPMRVYTSLGKKEQGRYALDVLDKCLTYYEDYFKIDYPLPKMDMIAIPDFASGAMENWGLVTYRETSLLLDPNNTSTSVKQNIAITVTHELAHQWFGNLVTMEWWTHLWLNEGFASFIEYLSVDNIFPEYDIWTQFVNMAYGGAMNLDALHSSHPIEVPVNHPSEVNEIFDNISYNKGSAVIRMLYEYIGDASFRKGMHEYLSKYAYKNAKTEDLWDSLEAASGKPVRKLMSCWTSQKGYPWLSVATTTEGGQRKMKLTQEKFTADGTLPDGDANLGWIIPISYISSDKPNGSEVVLMEGKTMEIPIPADGWVKLNPGTVGLYRVSYPDDMMQKLMPAIADGTLSATDRLGVESDYSALCQAGKVNSAQLLELIYAYKKETNYSCWSSINSSIANLNLILRGTDLVTNFHAFGRDLFSAIYQMVSWNPKPNEGHTDALTRALVIDRLVSFGEQSVIAEATNKFNGHIKSETTIPADLRGACYKAIAMYGNDADFDNLLAIYDKTDMSEEKNRVLRAIGFAREEKRLDRVVKFVMSDAVRYQSKIYSFGSLGASNPAVAWKLLKDHKDELRHGLGNGFMIRFVVEYCTEFHMSEERAQEIEQFFKENPFPGTERAVQQSLETIRTNINWLKRDREVIGQFLSNFLKRVAK